MCVWARLFVYKPHYWQCRSVNLCVRFGGLADMAGRVAGLPRSRMDPFRHFTTINCGIAKGSFVPDVDVSIFCEKCGTASLRELSALARSIRLS